MAEIAKEFTNIIQVLSTFDTALALGLNNKGQLPWLNFSDSIASRADLLANLEREEINQQYEKALVDREVSAATLMLLKMQNDWLGALARDLFDLRRGRLHRLACHVAEADGRAGAQGIHEAVILRYVQGTAENER